jgi:sulfatase maturation enzyme AslB (radical SAM superfamily)
MSIDLKITNDGIFFINDANNETLQVMRELNRMREIEDKLIRECRHCDFYRTHACPFSKLDVKRMVRINPKPDNAACEKYKISRDSDQRELEDEYFLLKLKRNL